MIAAIIAAVALLFGRVADIEEGIMLGVYEDTAAERDE
jgi:hypothetical protein